MPYNSDRKGWETPDGGLIRVNGSGDKVRIDVYEGDERQRGGHTRDSINYDTTSGTGRIDSHNADKSESSSTDIGCFLTTACMKYFQKNFDDNCEELTLLRWFRDNFVSNDDINHYYEIAPIIVKAINESTSDDEIYKYIYENVVQFCVNCIKNKDYDKAYDRYKNTVLVLEEEIAKPFLEQKLTKVLRLNISNA